MLLITYSYQRREKPPVYFVILTILSKKIFLHLQILSSIIFPELEQNTN